MSSYSLKKEILAQVGVDFESIDRQVLDEVYRFLDTLGTAGGEFQISNLPIDKMAELQARINEIINRSGYLSKVDTFIRDLNKITLNSIAELEGAGYGLQRRPLNEIETKWQDLTKQSLLGSGLNEGFVRPVLNSVDSAISLGKSVTELRKELSDYIVGGNDATGKLKSYTMTTAREVVSTLQGLQINGVANEMGFDYIQYTGGLLDDSRGQCYHWVRDLKGKIPKDQLKHEIDLAYKYQKEKKVIVVGNDEHRYGGMKPETNEKNFIINRGGWGCIHTAIPRRVRKK